jgi:UDP-N-acetyl-D-mannosaminuronic acid dehydrogenase
MDIRKMKIAVIGMGYVGIPAAVLLAGAGHIVTGIQRRSKRSGWKIDWINKGRCPIGGKEPGLSEMLKEVVSRGSLRVTDDFETLNEVDFILVDVQTPTDEHHIPQYESLIEVCHEIGKHLEPGKIVIVESTIAPGTTDNLVKPILENESGLRAGLPDGFGLCFSYERVMLGRLLHNIAEYPKIVGGIDELSTLAGIKLYQTIVHGGVFGTDPMTAEVSKTVENAYRDVQIAFANEVALLCESLGVDVYNVRKFVNGLPDDPSTPHANPVRNMHFPGPGVGGHCLPKDTWLLMHGYGKYGFTKCQYPASILTDARNLNDWMPVHMVDLLESALCEVNQSLRGSRIGVLGFAFLENSDDARNTPTIGLLQELEERGASYSLHDPYVKEDELYHIEPELDEALLNCDALVLMTKHDIYKSLSPARLKDLLKNRIVVDGRNLFNSAEFTAEGFIFRGVGKGNINNRIICELK